MPRRRHDAEAIAHVAAGRVVAFGVRDEEQGTEQLVLLAETETVDQSSTQAMIATVRARLSDKLGVSAQVVPVRPRTLRKSTSGKLSRAAIVRISGRACTTRGWRQRRGGE